MRTCLQAGPFLPKAEIKKQPWIQAYEDNNVDCGFMTELSGKGQIGKGLCPPPDLNTSTMRMSSSHILLYYEACRRSSRA